MYSFQWSVRTHFGAGLIEELGTSGLTPEELKETDKAMTAVTERSIEEFGKRDVYIAMLAEDCNDLLGSFLL